jgi:hypothetical protein
MGTTIQTITDPKTILWDTLRRRFDALKEAYPEKVNVFVSLAYPKTIQEIDPKEDEIAAKAVITVRRVRGFEDIRAVGDIASTSMNVSSSVYEELLGQLRTEHFEVSIWSLNSNYRDDIYLLTGLLLFDEKRELSRKGFIRFIFESGTDSEIQLEKLPRVVYRSSMTYLVTTKLQETKTEDLVSGMVITPTFY